MDPPKNQQRRRTAVKQLLRSLHGQRNGSFYSLYVQDEDGIEYVATETVHKNKVTLARIENGKVASLEPTRKGNFAVVARNGTPCVIQKSGHVIRSNRRTGARGFFHLRYGYIADDEAPAHMIESGRFDAADLKEWQSILENDVLGPCVNPPEGVRPCRTRFRRTLKTTATHEVIEKSRFLVCETKDDRPVEITTEMPAAWMRRLVVALGLSRKWQAATIDIKTAFLLVPLPPEHGDIYIRLPSHLPQCIQDLGFKPRAAHKLRKSLYGLKESPRLFNNFLSEKLAS